MAEMRHWVAPIDRVPDVLVTVTLECGPLRGKRIDEAPHNAVTVIEKMDDGNVVCYEKWSDGVFRYDPRSSDGPAFHLES